MVEGLIALAGVAVAAWLVMREAYPTVHPPETDAERPEALETETAQVQSVERADAAEPADLAADGPVTTLGRPPAALPTIETGRAPVAIVIREDLRLDDVLDAAAEDEPPGGHPALRLGVVVTILGLAFAGVTYVLVSTAVTLINKFLSP